MSSYVCPAPTRHLPFLTSAVVLVPQGAIACDCRGAMGFAGCAVAHRPGPHPRRIRCRDAMGFAGGAGAYKPGSRPPRHRAFWPAGALYAVFPTAPRRQSSGGASCPSASDSPSRRSSRVGPRSAPGVGPDGGEDVRKGRGTGPAPQNVARGRRDTRGALGQGARTCRGAMGIAGGYGAYRPGSRPLNPVPLTGILSGRRFRFEFLAFS